MDCPKCGAEMDVKDFGTYKNKEWINYICPECEHCEFEEPDWDSLPGGIDYIRDNA